MPPVQLLASLDRTIHEPARLVIIAILARVRSAEFTRLQRETGLTRGNLSAHLMRLEEAAFITVEKEFVARIPRTTLRLTETGRAAFDGYRRSIIAALGG